MKIWSFNIENHQIVLKRNFIFQELILLDTIVVSSKFTLFGSKHVFGVKDDDVEVIYILNNNYGLGIMFDLYKNDRLIVSGNKSSLWLILLTLWVIARILCMLSLRGVWYVWAEKLGRFIGGMF